MIHNNGRRKISTKFMVVLLTSFMLGMGAQHMHTQNSKVTVSWYGKRFHGRATASGELYDMYDYTAAHKHLPFGTLVQFTNPETKKTITVRINDRGPYIPGREYDLSAQAAEALGVKQAGVANVYATIIPPPSIKKDS